MGGRTGPLRREDRLLRPREFQHVTRHGRRAAVPGFVVLVAKSARCGGGPRLGVTVSRRVGRAVVRNRVKRRIREWFRRFRPELGPELDVVVIGRPGAGALAAGETERALCEAARRAAGPPA